MGTTPSRQQLAQRIQQQLLREIDYSIATDRLLADSLYARDVLLVCDAVPGELGTLAALFRQAPPVVPTRATDEPGHAPQATEWGRDTSGFGITQPQPMAQPHAARRASDSDSEPAPLQQPQRRRHRHRPPAP